MLMRCVPVAHRCHNGAGCIAPPPVPSSLRCPPWGVLARRWWPRWLSRGQEEERRWGSVPGERCTPWCAHMVHCCAGNACMFQRVGPPCGLLRRSGQCVLHEGRKGGPRVDTQLVNTCRMKRNLPSCSEPTSAPLISPPWCIGCTQCPPPAVPERRPVSLLSHPWLDARWHQGAL